MPEKIGMASINSIINASKSSPYMQVGKINSSTGVGEKVSHATANIIKNSISEPRNSIKSMAYFGSAKSETRSNTTVSNSISGYIERPKTRSNTTVSNSISGYIERSETRSNTTGSNSISGYIERPKTINNTIGSNSISGSISKPNKGGWNYTKLSSYIKNMKTPMNNATKALKKLREDILSVDKGDGKNAYWSGSRAVTQLTELRSHFNADIEWFNEIEKIVQLLEQIASYKI